MSRFEPLAAQVSTEPRPPSPPKKIIFNPKHKRKEASGIFKNIDFKALNAYRNAPASSEADEEADEVVVVPPSQPEKEVIEVDKSSSDSDSNHSEDEYGPAPPPPNSAAPLIRDVSSKVSYTLQFAKNGLGKSKHHKEKKSKKKKHKKENKHKKDKKKRS